MKLDKARSSCSPATPSSQIRPRSALGLKYIELQPGQLASRRSAPARRSPLDEVDQADRARRVLRHLGRRLPPRPAHGARGLRQRARRARARRSTRRSTDLVPFMTHLEPVMRDAVGPRHRAATTSSAQAAPHRRPDRARWRDTYAELFVNMGDHVRGADAATSRACASTIERLRPTRSRQGIRQLPGAAAVPARHRASCRGRLEPVARARSSARCRWSADALRRRRAGAGQGAAALPRHRERVPLARRPGGEPEHAAGAARPATARSRWRRRWWSYVAPYQTVCNYWIYYWTGIGEHVSENGARRHGAAQQPEVGQPHPGQPPARPPRPTGPSTCPKGQDPHDGQGAERRRRSRRSTAAPTRRRSTRRATPTARSASAATWTGPMQPGGRYAPDEDGGQAAASRGARSTCPASTGGTYKSRELGIDNLEDVP